MTRSGRATARRKKSRARRRAQKQEVEAKERTRREEAATVVQAAYRGLQVRQFVADRKNPDTESRYLLRLDDVTIPFGSKAHHPNPEPPPLWSPLPEGASGDRGARLNGSDTDCSDAALALVSPSHKERQIQPKASGRDGQGNRFPCSEQEEEGGGVSPSSTDCSVGCDDGKKDPRRRAISSASGTCGSFVGICSPTHKGKYLMEDSDTGFDGGKGGTSSAGSTAGSMGWDGYSVGVAVSSAGPSTVSNNGGVPWESNSDEGGDKEGSAVATHSTVKEPPSTNRDATFSTRPAGDGTGLTSWSTDAQIGGDGGDSGGDGNGNESRARSEALVWNAATFGEDHWTARTFPEEATGTGQYAVQTVGDLCQRSVADGNPGLHENALGRPSCWRVPMAEDAATLQGETMPIDLADAMFPGTSSQGNNAPSTGLTTAAFMFGKGAQSMALKGLLGIASLLPSQAAAAAAPAIAAALALAEVVAKIAPSFGENPASKALKGLLGLNACPLSRPAATATAAAVIPPNFGERAQSAALTGKSSRPQSSPSQQVPVVMAPGFGETSSSKALKGLLGLDPSSPPQPGSAASPVFEASRQLLNHEAMASTKLSSMTGGAGTTGAPADSRLETTAGSEAPKGLLGIGDTLVGFGGDGVENLPSPSALNASASVITPQTAAISLRGGAAALRPPPGFGTALQLAPGLVTVKNTAISTEGDVAALRTPPGFGTPPQLPQLPPSVATGGSDDVVLLAPAGSGAPFPLPSSPRRRCGAPPGFELSPMLQQQQTKAFADVIFKSDFATSPPTNFETGNHEVNLSSNFEDLGTLDVNGGRFGFVSGLANLDERVVTIGRQLGQGGCAVVHELEVLGADRRRALAEYIGEVELVVKVVPKGGSYAQEMSMMRELRVVQRIPSNCHKNIMNILSISEEKLSMVMPAAACDLRDLLEDKVVLSSMSFAARMMMMAGAARGLHYLHSELGLTHGDVKPENCLLAKGLVVKIADFGLSGSSQQAIGGLTKQYAAPEAIAVFQRQEIPQRTKLEPSLDLYSFGVMIPQILFIEEEARFGGKELATHGMTPKHPSFDAAFEHSLHLYKLFEATGSVEDRERLEAANSTIVDLHVDYAAQPAKMGDLRSTMLDPEKWNQPEELFFKEEVTVTLLSLLNKNPHRRASLDTVAGLLECPPLWAPAGRAAAPGCDNINENRGDEDCSRPRLPQGVRDTIDTTIWGGLLMDPALDTPSGVWWEAPEFRFPWWDNPPPLERLVL